MKALFCLFLCALFSFLPALIFGDCPPEVTDSVFPEPGKVASYAVVEFPFAHDGRNFLVTRELRFVSGETRWLAVDMENLQTALLTPEIDRISNWQSADLQTNGLLGGLKEHMLRKKSVFGEGKSALYRRETNTNALLTTDLCPTKRLLNRDFYRAVAEMAPGGNTNLPFIIFFSGEWMVSHEDDLEWLRTNGVRFIAGNHTFHHHIIAGKWPVEDFIADITNNEVTMIERGILPSCFFRFPGLTYGPEHIEALAKLNMLPLDCEMWMGQKDVPSWPLILLHSNGNVDIEVRMFRKFLERYGDAFRKGGFRFVTPAEWMKRRV
jgi:hypothetical protein